MNATNCFISQLAVRQRQEINSSRVQCPFFASFSIFVWKVEEMHARHIRRTIFAIAKCATATTHFRLTAANRFEKRTTITDATNTLTRFETNNG